MDDFAIVVFSCDKNDEVWPVFKHCLDKYWDNHPNTYLLTETIKYNEIKTICRNYEIDKWTRRIRESLEEIPENNLLFICDDCFLNKKINYEKFLKSLDLLNKDNVACVQYEVSGDPADIDCEYEGFKKKTPNSMYVVSLLCGIWKKDKLIKVIEEDMSPWNIEQKQDSKGFDYYQVKDDKILSWYRDALGANAAIRMGRWMPGIKEFLQEENLTINLNKKGLWPDDFWPRYYYLDNMINVKKDIIKKATEEKERYEKELYDMFEKYR